MGERGGWFAQSLLARSARKDRYMQPAQDPREEPYSGPTRSIVLVAPGRLEARTGGYIYDRRIAEGLGVSPGNSLPAPTV